MDSKTFWLNLIAEAIPKKVTDIHFSKGKVKFRIQKELHFHCDLSGSEYNAHLTYFLSKEIDQSRIKGAQGSVDIGASIGLERVRVNIFREQKRWAGVIRILPSQHFDWRTIGVPPEMIDKISNSKQGGLILITGPTGSGKSSTVASIIQYVNENFPYKIITIEDPTEYHFTDKKSDISQRDVGEDTDSYKTALRSALRQNPDVIYVGEIRDHESAEVALHAASTGHLVFSTMHTSRVHDTISTYIGMLDEAQQSLARHTLANNLLATMCQRLIPSEDGGVVCCREVLFQCTAAQTYIRSKGKEKGLINVMQSGRDKGMIDWNSAVLKLRVDGLISRETADLYKDDSDSLS